MPCTGSHDPDSTGYARYLRPDVLSSGSGPACRAGHGGRASDGAAVDPDAAVRSSAPERVAQAGALATVDRDAAGPAPELSSTSRSRSARATTDRGSRPGRAGGCARRWPRARAASESRRSDDGAEAPDPAAVAVDGQVPRAEPKLDPVARPASTAWSRGIQPVAPTGRIGSSTFSHSRPSRTALSRTSSVWAWRDQAVTVATRQHAGRGPGARGRSSRRRSARWCPPARRAGRTAARGRERGAGRRGDRRRQRDGDRPTARPLPVSR